MKNKKKKLKIFFIPRIAQMFEETSDTLTLSVVSEKARTAVNCSNLHSALFHRIFALFMMIPSFGFDICKLKRFFTDRTNEASSMICFSINFACWIRERSAARFARVAPSFDWHTFRIVIELAFDCSVVTGAT